MTLLKSKPCGITWPQHLLPFFSLGYTAVAWSYAQLRVPRELVYVARVLAWPFVIAQPLLTWVFDRPFRGGCPELPGGT